MTQWLISSMGTSPEVLTEAIFALEQARIPVARVTCVGTGEAFQHARDKIFSPGGALERLREYLGKPADWLASPQAFHWETEPLGANDSRNRSEALAMDRAFRRAILHAQDAGQGPVLACISGGRKTMSSSLQQAMTLLARPEDEAFHILLNLPKGLTEGDVFKSGFAFPGDPLCPALGKVTTEIIEVPLVRLRALAANRGINLADAALVQHCQRAVQEIQVAPSLLLDLATLNLHLILDGHHFRIRKMTAPHALLLGAWGLASPQGMRRVEARPALERVLAIWRRMPDFFPIVLPGSQKIEYYIQDWTYPGTKRKNTFEMAVTRLKGALTEGNPLLDPFAIRSLDSKGTADPRYGFEAEVYKQGLFRLSLGAAGVGAP